MSERSTHVFQRNLILEPGHILVWKQGNVQVRKYWHMNFGREADKSSIFETVEELDRLLAGSVHLRLMSEVPWNLLFRWS